MLLYTIRNIDKINLYNIFFENSPQPLYKYKPYSSYKNICGYKKC